MLEQITEFIFYSSISFQKRFCFIYMNDYALLDVIFEMINPTANFNVKDLMSELSVLC